MTSSSGGNNFACRARGHALGSREGGTGHDVQVACVGREVMRGAFDLEKDRGLEAAQVLADAGENRRPGFLLRRKASFFTCAEADVASKITSMSAKTGSFTRPSTPSCVVATPMRAARASPSEAASMP